MKRCCFCGHGREEDTPTVIFDKIVEYLEVMININRVDEFYSGGMGKFDKMAEQAVIQLKKKYPNIKLLLVMPYLKN